jgi:hypothetical protein
MHRKCQEVPSEDRDPILSRSMPGFDQLKLGRRVSTCWCTTWERLLRLVKVYSKEIHVSGRHSSQRCSMSPSAMAERDDLYVDLSPALQKKTQTSSLEARAFCGFIQLGTCLNPARTRLDTMQLKKMCRRINHQPHTSAGLPHAETRPRRFDSCAARPL